MFYLLFIIPYLSKQILLRKSFMGSDVSNSSNKLNINHFYTPKQLLTRQIGKPILLEAKQLNQKANKSTQDNVQLKFIQKYFFAIPQQQFDLQKEKKMYDLRIPQHFRSIQKNLPNNQNKNFDINLHKKNYQQANQIHNFVHVFEYNIQKQPYSKCMNNDYILQVYTQHISVRLANIKKITKIQNQIDILWTPLSQQQALFIYKSCLNGYNQIENIFKQSGQIFNANLSLPTQLNIGINCQGEVKVWINCDFSKNNQFPQTNSLSEHKVIIGELIMLISQRCVGSNQFVSKVNLYPDNSYKYLVEEIQRKFQNEIKTGKNQIKNRFNVFQKDNNRWRCSRQKLSMKNYSCIKNLQFSKIQAQNKKYPDNQQNGLVRRYHSQSKIKQATIFHKQNAQLNKNFNQIIFQSRYRSASQHSKYSFATKQLINSNSKLNLKTGNHIYIQKNDSLQKQSNRILMQASSNHVYVSPAIKKNVPLHSPKKNLAFGYSNSGKKQYSQSITNIYSLTNNGSPIFFQNPSQFYLNKPVATLLSDPIVSQSSKMNKQIQSNKQQQEKLYYKNKSFKQNQMAKFIHDKLNFHQNCQAKLKEKENQRCSNTHSHTSQLLKRPSSKLLFQESSRKKQKDIIEADSVKLQIKQFKLKDPDQFKDIPMSLTQGQKPKFNINIQGFESVKQNKSKLQTSRQHIPIINSSQRNLNTAQNVSQNSSEKQFNIINSQLSIFDKENGQYLHHSLSSVKIPTSVQLQNSIKLDNLQNQEFALLQKKQSLQKYKRILENAIHSNQQIQQIRPIMLPTKYQINTQTLEQQQVFPGDIKLQDQKNMTLSGKQLANQFKMLLQSVQLQSDKEQTKPQNTIKYEQDGSDRFEEKSIRKKNQTLDDFIDRFNVQITQMSEEDDQSVSSQTKRQITQ